MENQKIKCTVHDCTHCNCESNECQLNEIKVCHCAEVKQKDATMCDSYKKDEK